MEYTQILSEDECKGKTIDRIVDAWRTSTFIIFTDKTYCIYNVGFDTEGMELDKKYNHAAMVKLGFMKVSEQVSILAKEKKRVEKQKKINDIKALKRLNALYPDALKS